MTWEALIVNLFSAGAFAETKKFTVENNKNRKANFFLIFSGAISYVVPEVSLKNKVRSNFSVLPYLRPPQLIRLLEQLFRVASIQTGVFGVSLHVCGAYVLISVDNNETKPSNQLFKDLLFDVLLFFTRAMLVFPRLRKFARSWAH